MKKVPAEPLPSSLRRTTAAIAATYFILGLADPNAGLWQLPLQWFLKENLHLPAEQMAYFFAAALFPWYLKPLVGLISDAIPIFGSRRRSYLGIGAGTAVLVSFALLVIPREYSWLLAGALTLHTALMLISTVAGGFLVEEGRRYSLTGRLTSWRSAAESAATICAGPIGGWIAGKNFGWAAGITFCLATTLVAVYATCIHETFVPLPQRSHARGKLISPIAALLRVREVWIAAGMFCCYQIAPGFQTPLFYRQTNVLRFDAPLIGKLTLISSVCGIAGAGIYAWICRRVSFRWLLPVSLGAGIVVTLCYLEYDSVRTATAIEASNGLIGTFAFVALLDLIARSLPPGQEALGYAVVFSIGNLASSASDIIGSRWFDAGMSFHSLVWINAGTTALAFVAIPLLSKRSLREEESSLAPH